MIHFWVLVFNSIHKSGAVLIWQGETLQFAASCVYNGVILSCPRGGRGGGRGQMCTNVLYTSYMITVEKVTDASYESDAAATASIKV